MALKLLHLDYVFSGPWGDEMTAEYSDLAHRIATVPGLIWKIWTENRETGEAGGVYLFEDEPALDAYLETKLERMKAAGTEGLRVRKFDVNEPLTWITRGRLRPNLQRRNYPAGDAAFREFLAKCSFDLPEDYLGFIRSVNGAEGELAIDPWWFQLWPIEDVLKHNEGYQVETFHPTYFGFGSSGGGVMFAFKQDAVEPSTVFGIPFDSIDPNDIQIVAETFVAFTNAMGYSSRDDA